MGLKNIDFKGLMLKHGQYVALGVGVAALLPLSVMGLGMVLSSGRSSANVKVLQDSDQRAKNNLQSSRPPEDAAKPPPEMLVELKFTPVDPMPYDTDQPWYVPSTIEDTRRRNPEVLLASDFQTQVVRGAFHSYLIVPGSKGPQVGVLADKSMDKTKLVGRQKRLFERLQKELKKAGLSGLLNQNGGGMNGMPGMPGGPGASGGGMAMGGMGGKGGGMGGMGMGGAPGGGAPGSGQTMGPGGMGGMGGRGGFGGGGMGAGMLGNTPGQRLPGMMGTRRIEMVDIDKIGEHQLAEQLTPVRMIVINGSFPYRKELEEFRSKLRKHSVSELMNLIDSGEAEFAFQGFVVERQVYGPDGKVKMPWQDYTKEMVENLASVYSRAIDFQQEDPLLTEYGMVTKGLVAPRPLLARDVKYPPLEVKSLKDAIDTMNKQMTPEVKRSLSDLERKLSRKGAFNNFDPFTPFKDEEEQPAQAQQPKPGEKGNPSEDLDAELVVPDRVLVRLIDFVQPGYSYEYRIKTKMANPNYKSKLVAYPALAKPKELVASDWAMVPKVEVPSESLWYAVDPRADAEKVTLQMHKWVDYLLPQSDLSASNSVAVGDWSILEREPTFRGDYIGRLANVQVPIWSTENEIYEFAHGARKNNLFVPVDFAAKEANLRSPAVLVDFAGGKGHITKIGDKQIREDLPLELLVLNPDGKLILRNSVDDEADKDRTAREEEWRKWIAQVKTGAITRLQQRMNPGGMGGAGGSGKPGNGQ